VASRTPIVAVVDDDLSVRRSLARLLNTSGFIAEYYSSAEAFLEAKAEDRMDFLILDIHLTRMSGIQLRRRLTALAPVIFITASGDDRIEREALEAGCIACLRKPFSAELLVNSIKDALAVHLIAR